MKRFTDTELWKKPWFMELTPVEKLAFYYIKDQCDNVGVGTPNYRLAEFIIGSQLDWQKFAGKCNGNIYVMENGKWWLVDFCSYQHADLVNNPDGGASKALKSYVKLLREHGLYDIFIQYVNGHSMGIESPYLWAQGTGKGTGKGKGKGSADFHEKTGRPINLTRYSTLCEEHGQTTVDEYIQRIADYSDSTGKKYKDYAATAANWIRDDIAKGKLTPAHDDVIIAKPLTMED